MAEVLSQNELSFCEKRKQPCDMDELLQELSKLNINHDFWLQTASRVFSHDLVEQLAGTRQFRMMLSVAGEIPIQAVVDTGVVPKLVELIKAGNEPTIQFEAAWALTNIASGTPTQTETVVKADAIPHLVQLLEHSREEVREQGIWGLGNIAGDRPEFRDLVLSYPGYTEKFVQACMTSRRSSTIRTGVWSLSNMCRGKPRPAFSSISAAVPYLSNIIRQRGLDCPETLSDACWALDGLSEHPEGLAAIIETGLVPHLCSLLSHHHATVQRPALRVIGQIAAGTFDQTEEILRCGTIQQLLQLLRSSRKSARKDACWTLSNIAAGSSSQLMALLNAGAIPQLVSVFQTDAEVDVKKEAAWAICNACTAEVPDHLDYLISSECVQPVCEMLRIEDVKILEVALEALENILAFGEKMQVLRSTGENICAQLVHSANGFINLHAVHSNLQGCGSYTIWEKSGALLRKWTPHFNDKH